MKTIVDHLLRLSNESHGFVSPKDAHLADDNSAALLLCGKGLHIDELPPPAGRKKAWLSRSALPFDLERAATGVIYSHLRVFVDELIEYAFDQTDAFQKATPEWIYENPQILPVITHVAGTFSKQELSRVVGHISDAGISKPAGKRLAKLLSSLRRSQVPKPDQVRERMKATTEGIVRDLVGRILLEEFVASALRRSRVPFRREGDYEALSGVVYDFRADFVVPEEDHPKAFVEVRKSSTRHASLYAKDKMFSAINWKGRHQDCLGILVVDGPWTGSSLEVMTKVFDYVVPISRISQVTEKIRDYLEGDKSVLRWLVHFRIDPHVAS